MNKPKILVYELAQFGLFTALGLEEMAMIMALGIFHNKFPLKKWLGVSIG